MPGAHLKIIILIFASNQDDDFFCTAGLYTSVKALKFAVY